MAGDKYQMDMCRGPLLRKIVIYTIPLIASAMIHQLFSAADLIVVGRFSPHQDMAAVGSCLPICSLIVNVFFGIAVGAGVLCANGIGAKDKLLTSRAIHTAILFAASGGVVLMLAGLAVAKPLLHLMDTPDDVMDKAAWYMRIYCLGLPTLSVYVYGAALLRAMGDTKRPLYYLIFSGIVNVVLNYIMVAFFSMGAVGVALATMFSFILSAYLVVRALTGMPGALKLKKSLLKIDFTIFRKMLWIGLPAGIQGSFFAISNFVLQGATNSFGSSAMAGNAAALNIECIIYSACFGFNQTATSFSGQNFGAQNYQRVAKSSIYCIWLAGIGVGLFGIICTIFGKELLSIYNPDPEVVAWGMQRLRVVFVTYALCAIMDCISGTLRGIGHSVGPMLVTLFCICVLRVAWVWWAFPLHPTISMLMLSYPLSWSMTCILTGTHLYFAMRKLLHHSSTKYAAIPK